MLTCWTLFLGFTRHGPVSVRIASASVSPSAAFVQLVTHCQVEHESESDDNRPVEQESGPDDKKTNQKPIPCTGVTQA